MKVAQRNDIEPYRAGLIWKYDDPVIRQRGRCTDRETRRTGGSDDDRNAEFGNCVAKVVGCEDDREGLCAGRSTPDEGEYAKAPGTPAIALS